MAPGTYVVATVLQVEIGIVLILGLRRPFSLYFRGFVVHPVSVVTAGFAQLSAITVLFCPIAGNSGAVEGHQCGRMGVSLIRSCLRGIGRSLLVSSAGVLGLFVAIVAATAAALGSTDRFYEWMVAGIFAAPILGILASLVPAPMAAFVAYNFGARKRAEEELARQSQPPVTDNR